MLEKPPIKVLQVLGSLGMGGAETWLMEVLRLWSTDRSRYPRMDFLITGQQRGLFDDEAQRLGANVFYVRFQRKQLLRFTMEFRRILRTERYEAIHDHS